jgi:hypothetical protein
MGPSSCDILIKNEKNSLDLGTSRVKVHCQAYKDRLDDLL